LGPMSNTYGKPIETPPFGNLRIKTICLGTKLRNYPYAELLTGFYLPLETQT